MQYCEERGDLERGDWISDIVSRSISKSKIQKRLKFKKGSKNRRNEKVEMGGIWQSATNILAISNKSPKIDQENDGQKCLGK